MKRLPMDKDPFNIKESQNRIDSEHRNRVIEMEDCGEESPYQTWVGDNNGYDPLSSESITDSERPWGISPHDNSVEEQWEALLELVPVLPRLQRSVIDVLFTGETNQTKIAEILGITQPAVKTALRGVAKKILKKVRENTYNLDDSRPELEENPI